LLEEPWLAVLEVDEFFEEGFLIENSIINDNK
jgi:hypothetical protein